MTEDSSDISDNPDTTEETTDESTTPEVQTAPTATTGFKFSGETKTFQAYHPDQWTTPLEVLFSEFEIDETDLKVKTFQFTSPHDIDLTTGRVCAWIQSKYGDNVGGIILSKSYDAEKGLYTYKCQDWNRLLNSPVYVILAGDMTAYDIIKILLVKNGLSTDGLHDIEYYDNTMERVPSDDDPYETFSSSDTYSNQAMGTVSPLNDSDPVADTAKEERRKEARNPFRQRPEGLYDKETMLDFIRALILKPGAMIDFYMDENGVPRFDKYVKDDWLKERWYFVDTDVINAQLTHDITDIITQEAIKRVDPLNTDATLYTSEKTVGINLAKFFGVMGDMTDNPVPNTTSNDGGATYSGDVITITGKRGCGHCMDNGYITVTRTYINECPFCGKHNLQDTPKDPTRKKIPEGEVTCGGGVSMGKHDGCDADFCVNCGHEKMDRDAAQLTPVGFTPQMKPGSKPSPATVGGSGFTSTGQTSTPSTSQNTTSNGTSVDATSTDETETPTTTPTVTPTATAVEDVVKNKQVARIKLTENLRDTFEFKMSLIGEFPNLTTNSFCMIKSSNRFFMQNMSKIGKKLNGKFLRYAGYEKNRYYIEEVHRKFSQSTGYITTLTLNPFASSYSTFAKIQIKAEAALMSAIGGGSAGNANGTDCNDSTSRTNAISVSYGGSATAQTPTPESLAVIGNSSANYAQIARNAGGNPATALKTAYSMFKYLTGYADNAYGAEKCPQKMYATGRINCNCADAAWFMKCVFDCMGLQNYILHGSPCGTGHYWNCVNYGGRWLMGDLCYWGRSHNELSRM